MSDKGDMTWREANSNGGKTTAARRTADERRDQAGLGGQAASEKLGSAHFAAMGKKGGAETKRRYGTEFYRNRMRKPGTPTQTQKLIERAMQEPESTSEP